MGTTTQSAGQAILVVDDEEKILEITQMVLEKEGYQVITADTGQKALQKMGPAIDLVLLDIKLPDTDGYSLCRAIKANEETRDVPVILLTSLDGIDNKVKGLDVGANDYLVKPFLQKELLARIRSHLREREFTREVKSLYSLEKRRTHELLVLNKLITEFNQSLDPKELLQHAAKVISDGLGYQGCVIAVGDGEKEGFLVKACFHSQLEEPINPAELMLKDARLVKIAAGKTPMVAADLSAESRAFRFFLGTQSQMAVPLISHERVEGIILVESNWPNAYGRDDLNLLSAVAGNLALALRNAELYSASQLHSESLQSLVEERTREIEKQKKFLECVVDSLPQGIYVIDRNFSVVTWNKKRETGILGIPREQVIGKELFSVFPTMVQDALKAEFEKVLSSGQPYEAETVSWVSGEKRFYHIRKIPMNVEDDGVSYVITLAEDISERKRLEESLFTNGKLASLGRLAAGIAHEINNPLAAIAGCVEGLISRSKEPALCNIPAFEDFPSYLKIIDDEIVRCKGIINNLLDFSRTKEILQEPLSINVTLEQTLQLLIHHKAFKRIQVVKELDPQLPPVTGNSGEMRQVFLAMAINAMDAMNEVGSLTIRSGTESRDGQEYVCIQFQDTGVGIPQQNLNKIFDPFFTTKPVGKGVGLGLSICYGIVRSHNGFIKVASEEGKGTLFEIYIPVSPVREQVA
jgi:two-component system NtrC family sensor kinase